MKDKKNLITLIIGIIIGICITGIVVCFTVNKLNLATIKVNEKNNETKELEETYIPENKENKAQVKENIKTTKKEKTYDVTKKQEQNKSVSEKTGSSQSSEVKIPKTKEEISNEIVQLAKNVETEILTEENINKALQKAKQNFIKITDFIFYGTKINGYTFNDLTEQAKLQLMSIVMRIDAKLEQYKPGYKEDINLKIDDIESKLTIKYLEVSSKICTKIGSVACEQAKQDLQVLKEDINLTIDWLKVMTSNSLSSLEEWYQIFKNSN